MFLDIIFVCFRIIYMLRKKKKKNAQVTISKTKQNNDEQLYFSFCVNRDNEESISLSQATNTQAPPAALIFSSARCEKNFALTISGCWGRTPLPNTLK
jgi:hypothetical protein